MVSAYYVMCRIHDNIINVEQPKIKVICLTFLHLSELVGVGNSQFQRYVRNGCSHMDAFCIALT